VVVVAGVLVKRLVFPPQSTPFYAAHISAGERLDLPDVDWEAEQENFLNSSGTVERVWFGNAAGCEKRIREEFLAVAEKAVQ